MPASEREFHRRVARDSFNRAWDLLDKKKRSKDDDVQMLHLAHASRYHWGLVGSPRNKAVGEWQVSRIYSELGQPELALRFANQCLRGCKEARLSEVEATAYEAMARAYAIAKDYSNARGYMAKAHRQLDKLSLDREDRAIYLKQFKETEALIKG